MREDSFESQEEMDEEYARRILQEIEHIERPMTEQEEQEEESQDEEPQEPEPPKERSKAVGALWLILSGNVLLAKGLTKYYGQMLLIAALSLLSIIVMFNSLHLDMKYNSLRRDVQLLRERSIRLQERSASLTSHSAIESELRRRGMDIESSTTPTTVVEKEGFWGR